MLTLLMQAHFSVFSRIPLRGVELKSFVPVMPGSDLMYFNFRFENDYALECFLRNFKIKVEKLERSDTYTSYSPVGITNQRDDKHE